MSKKYRGVDRNKIPWGPRVDYEKCNKCETCVKYCKLGVYTTYEEQGKIKPIVSYPNNCVVFCTGCENQCPTGAITFPSKKQTRELIQKLKNNSNNQI